MRQADIRLYDFEHDPQIADKPDLPPFTLITDRSMKERLYAWGTCEMNNAAHSDFTLLKDLVIKKHLEIVYVYTHTRTHTRTHALPVSLLPLFVQGPRTSCCLLRSISRVSSLPAPLLLLSLLSPRFSYIASHGLPCRFLLTRFAPAASF